MSETTNIEKDHPTLPHLASTTNPDSGETQSAPATSSGEKTHEEESNTTRESKRRKGCPKALDKVQDLTRSNNQNNFSFTFDTKFSGCPPEFTPKFGSFNLTVKDLVQSSKDRETSEEEEKKAAVISQEVVNLNENTTLRSVDGV
ncbi:hypothetical protein HS088_TW13G00500 [Tripterygium wilfordii]|uniref:Uncharacterized protein n=1 Tax=Tripterygium wilfordii TaxID=458696 RepID=A0A7J7CU60_TRIWF|nr:hypothetical protein HS088_TW13G00500 [Tripterygium wilfordii]